MKTKSLFAGMLLIAAIAISSTGCMTSHGSGEYIGDKDALQTFSGWTTDPDQEVHLYVISNLIPQEWAYLGEAKVGTSAYTYFGQKWYFWYLKAYIPEDSWISAANTAPGDYLTIIKAENQYGSPLYYFEADFYSYYDNYNSLEDLWLDRGVNSSNIVIFGD